MERPQTRAAAQEQRRKALAARIHECRGLGMSVALTCEKLEINERMYYKCFHESGGTPNETNKPLRCVAREMRSAYEGGSEKMPSVAQIIMGKKQINRVDRGKGGKFTKKGAGTPTDTQTQNNPPNARLMTLQELKDAASGHMAQRLSNMLPDEPSDFEEIKQGLTVQAAADASLVAQDTYNQRRNSTK